MGPWSGKTLTLALSARRALPALLVAALLWRCQRDTLEAPGGPTPCDKDIAQGDPCSTPGTWCNYVYRPCHDRLNASCGCGGFDNRHPNTWDCLSGDPKSSSQDCIGTCSDLADGKLVCPASSEGEVCANPACFGHFCTCRDGGYDCDLDASDGCTCTERIFTGRACHQGWSCKPPPECRCHCATAVQATCDCAGGAWTCDSGPEPDCDGGTDGPSDDGATDAGPG